MAAGLLQPSAGGNPQRCPGLLPSKFDRIYSSLAHYPLARGLLQYPACWNLFPPLCVGRPVAPLTAARETCHMCTTAAVTPPTLCVIMRQFVAEVKECGQRGRRQWSEGGQGQQDPAISSKGPKTGLRSQKACEGFLRWQLIMAQARD